MTDQRNLRLDLFALGLLAAVVFLAMALFTYSPADPVVELVAPLDRLFQPDVLVFPQSTTVENACGQWGALVASMLLTGLGVGAYYVVISLGTLDVWLLARRPIDAPWTRTFGWTLSLVGFTTVTALTVPHWSPGPVIGAGGYLGALGAGLLEMHFATAGSLIFATSLILGGLLLSTDYALVQVTQLVLRTTVNSVSRSRELIPAAKSAGKRGRVTDLTREELSIRIGGVTLDRPAADDELSAAEEEREEEEAWDDDELDEQEAEADEVVVKRQVKGGAGETGQSGPRVRNRSNKSERQQVIESLDEASLNADHGDYQLPSLDLLLTSDEICFESQAKEVRRKAKILEQTFANFGFNVRVVEIETGPVIAQYEVELEAGLRLSKITGLADDLAIALRVPSVRIVAPIPGKNTVGIEVPNEVRQVVRLREVMEETNGKVKKMKVPLFLGKDVRGNALTVDLATMPHLLIAGRTGTGKSVCLNAIISSILMTRRPDEVRMLMIDPKMVELSGYGRLPHLMHPVVTDMRKAEAILAWAVDKMEERYALLARTGVRHIASYNQLGKEELTKRLQPETDEERDAIPDQLPFIVIVADEIADMMMTAGKEVEQHIIRLAQKSRAVGIHLILATQKPTVDVITGLIKSNLPARIAFQVASRTDSRVVLDEMGADKLLGNGDMLFLWPGTSTLLRGQGTYLSDEEINAIVDVVSTGEQNFVNELVNMKVEQSEENALPGQLRKRDELYESAIDVVVREGRGSVSLLQRALGIGYGRAARLIDFMAEDGIVGEYNGSQAREVVLSPADWDQMQGLEAEIPTPAPPPKPRRNNVVLPEPEFEEEEDEDEERDIVCAAADKRPQTTAQRPRAAASFDQRWEDADDEPDDDTPDPRNQRDEEDADEYDEEQDEHDDEYEEGDEEEEQEDDEYDEDVEEDDEQEDDEADEYAEFAADECEAYGSDDEDDEDDTGEETGDEGAFEHEKQVERAARTAPGRTVGRRRRYRIDLAGGPVEEASEYGPDEEDVGQARPRSRRPSLKR